MPRPVQGFLTRDGTYFDTEDEAEVFEAGTEMFSLLRLELDKFVDDGSVKEYLMAYITAWLGENSIVIERWLKRWSRYETDTPFDLAEDSIASNLGREGIPPIPGQATEAGGGVSEQPGDDGPEVFDQIPSDEDETSSTDARIGLEGDQGVHAVDGQAPSSEESVHT